MCVVIRFLYLQVRHICGTGKMRNQQSVFSSCGVMRVSDTFTRTIWQRSGTWASSLFDSARSWCCLCSYSKFSKGPVSFSWRAAAVVGFEMPWRWKLSTLTAFQIKCQCYKKWSSKHLSGAAEWEITWQYRQKMKNILTDRSYKSENLQQVC